MSGPTRREFLAAVPLAAAALNAQSPTAEHGLALRFDRPASEWSEALPLGNGRLGAMAFGGVASERLQLNEDTLWSGCPRPWNNPDALRHLPEVRRLVLQDRNYVAADQVCKEMQGPFNESYEPMADLRIDFDGHDAPVEYSRVLDLDRAVAEVSYRVGDVRFTREAFVSAPDQVIAVRISASRPGALNLTIALDSPLHSDVNFTGAGEITLAGKAPAHVAPNYHEASDPVEYSPEDGRGMRFGAILHATAEGGSLGPLGSRLRVERADSCTILIAAATGFRSFDAFPTAPIDAVMAPARASLTAARAKTWDQLRQAHERDHQSLFRRVHLQLGPAAADARPVPERIKATADHADPALLALYFHFGRYLLIASSRPGTQPANLQGIWNSEVRPPWSCNWTANINVQMNYWPAETCNLSDCHFPLFDLIDGVSRNGAETARVNYGLPGWVSHHNLDLWRQSAPVGLGTGSPTWANWPMSGPWICAHLWEHYRFTGDRDFLSRRAYPIMLGSARFYLGWLIDDGRGGVTTCPSFSTENNFLTPEGKTAETSAGCTMDIALIRELFRNCVAAMDALNVDSASDLELRAQIRAALAKLPPYKIGRYGQLQEWSEDFAEATPGQRHMSHLYGLYPGSDITPRRTPELAQAARTSLERRLAHGGAYTGWSRAWAIAFWARLGDGKMAEESLTMLMKHSTGPALLDTHPAEHGSIFQIDGNFGAAAAIVEMLVQSHDGEITLLPALPANWSEGEFGGIQLRGGAELDLIWKGGRAVSARLRSRSGATLRIRAPKGQTVNGRELAEVRVPAGGVTPLRLA